MKSKILGFTLIELIVVIAIIGLLSSVLFASFDEARKQSRDKVRMATLKEMQLAIELYKAQHGQYPAAGCASENNIFYGPGPVNGVIPNLSTCDNYIAGLVPDFIASLPRDPRFENDNNRGFYYRSDGNSYKLMIRQSVETLLINDWSDEFARCPSQAVNGQCSAVLVPPSQTYAVYSPGAEHW